MDSKGDATYDLTWDFHPRPAARKVESMTTATSIIKRMMTNESSTYDRSNSFDPGREGFALHDPQLIAHTVVRCEQTSNHDRKTFGISFCQVELRPANNSSSNPSYRPRFSHTPWLFIFGGYMIAMGYSIGVEAELDSQLSQEKRSGRSSFGMYIFEERCGSICSLGKCGRRRPQKSTKPTPYRRELYTFPPTNSLHGTIDQKDLLSKWVQFMITSIFAEKEGSASSLAGGREFLSGILACYFSIVIMEMQAWVG